MKKFFKDFKAFISRGNILDMAVGVIIGGAFNAIVTAFTNGIIMPLINLLLSFGGENGLESAVTILKKGYDADGAFSLQNSIYIDWGAFISAIINFLIIALTLFVMIKVAMKSSQLFHKGVDEAQKNKMTKEEKEELINRGVNMKDRRAKKEALTALRLEKEEAKKAEEAAKALEPKPQTEAELLGEIRDLLRAQQSEKVHKKTEK